jgi:hypothetical protein
LAPFASAADSGTPTKAPASKIALDYRSKAADFAVKFFEDKTNAADPDTAATQQAFVKSQSPLFAGNAVFMTAFAAAIKLVEQFRSDSGTPSGTALDPSSAAELSAFIAPQLAAPAGASSPQPTSIAAAGPAAPSPSNPSTTPQTITPAMVKGDLDAIAANDPVKIPNSKDVYIAKPIGFRIYSSEGARVLDPYTLTTANGSSKLTAGSPTVKGFVQFNVDTTWAWDPSREMLSPPHYGYPNASFDNAANIGFSQDDQEFTWVFLDHFTKNLDTRFDLGFNFANGSTPSASTVTSGGDVYSEWALETPFFRGLLAENNLDTAYSVNLFGDINGDTDQGNLAVHTLFMTGIDAVIGWTPTIGAATTSTTLPERGLFRFGLGWASFDNVIFSPPGSNTLQTTNGGTTPAFSHQHGYAAKADLYYPVGTGKWLNFGGYQVLSDVKPAAWTFYLGYTLNPSDFIKLFVPASATATPASPTPASQ